MSLAGLTPKLASGKRAGALPPACCHACAWTVVRNPYLQHALRHALQWQHCAICDANPLAHLLNLVSLVNSGRPLIASTYTPLPLWSHPSPSAVRPENARSVPALSATCLCVRVALRTCLLEPLHTLLAGSAWPLLRQSECC